MLVKYHPGGNISTDGSHSNSTLLNQSRNVFLKYTSTLILPTALPVLIEMCVFNFFITLFCWLTVSSLCSQLHE